MNENNVILIGFMGAGKTTVGRRLSYMLKKIFIDMDCFIENEDGRIIKQIFEEDGETYFRNLETKMLKKIEKDPLGHVISAGGGLPLRVENQKIIKRMGTVIYLRVKPETVLSRIEQDTTRPLLQVENTEERIITMLGERDPIYTNIADLIVDVDQKTFQVILKEIKMLLREEGDKN